MEVKFWKQRWQENQTGFHLDQVNPYLEQFWPALQLTPNSHVFVPLCGKSIDLIWLEKSGYKVTGVECSQLAINAFFAENNLQFDTVHDQVLNTCIAGNIQLLHGDFFDLQRHDLAGVNAVYDRAALVALPPDMRQRYAQKLIDILPARTAMLLITLEYNQASMSGPPFSVPEIEVRSLYSHCYDIHRLQQMDVLSAQPRFAQRGLDRLVESVYLLQPKY
jgi:thiopurine S-methyltransferase